MLTKIGLKRLKSWEFVGLIVLLSFNLVFRAMLAFSNGVFGDGGFYTTLAKEIVQTGRLQPTFPHQVVDVVNGEREYMPVCYPQLYFVLLGGCLLIGGEKLVLLFAPIIGTLTILVSYFLAKEFFGKTVAVLVSIFLTGEVWLLLISSWIYFDVLVSFFAVLGIYMYVLAIKRESKWFILFTSISVGALIATKQTGMVIALVFAVFTALLVVFRKAAERKRILRKFLICSLFALLISSPFLFYEVYATGTLSYPPDSLPLFKEKWQIDERSSEYLWRYIYTSSYNPLQRPAWFMINLFYMPSVSAHGEMVFLSVISIITQLLGVIFLIKERKTLFLSLWLSFVAVIFPFIALYQLVVPRYFHILKVFSTFLMAIGALWIAKTLKGYLQKALQHRVSLINSKRILFPSSLIFVLTIFVLVPSIISWQIGYNQAYNWSDHTSGGGYWSDKIERYIKAGDWVKQNIPKDALIVGGRWEETIYYSKRDTIWIFWLGAHDVPKIFSAPTPSLSLQYLEEYDIDYVWIDQLQIHKGHLEQIINTSLLDYIDFCPFFQKVYQNDLIRIYKVEYSNSFALENSHYYSNVFGDYDDLYNVSPVWLKPDGGWLLGENRRIAKSTETCYINVRVSTIPLDTSSDNLTETFSIVLYYYDTFCGSASLEVLNMDQSWKTVCNMTGTGSGDLKYTFSIENLTSPVDSYVRFQIPPRRFDIPIHSFIVIPGRIDSSVINYLENSYKPTEFFLDEMNTDSVR